MDATDSRWLCSTDVPSSLNACLVSPRPSLKFPMSQWTPEFNELYTLKVAMKSGTPDAPTTQESLKAVLLHPQPLGATKSFPAEVEMINSKVGNEFSHLCDDSQKQEKDMNGNQQEQEKKWCEENAQKPAGWPLICAELCQRKSGNPRAQATARDTE